MIRFILKRLFFETVPTMLVIATVTFFLIRLAPGGPFSKERNIPPETLKALNAYYGFDKPLLVQYFSYLVNALHGDLGPSTRYIGHSVNELIAGAFPVSLELGIYALLFALIVGVSAGVIASLKPNSRIDYASMSLSMAGICIPSFVLGPLLVLLFSLWLPIFNVSGWNEPRDRVLPALTLGMIYMAYMARLTRGGMLEILVQDFIRTARAKGLSTARIVVVHALRGGILPVISFLGPAAAGLITGSFVVETIFDIPGLGRMFITASFNRDYSMILGTVLFYAIIIIAFNTIVDIVQALLDPRVRNQIA